MDQTIVEAAPREERGKNSARRMRAAGHVPAVIYGGKDGAVALAVNTKQLSAILRTEGGHNTIFKIKMPTGDQAAMVKDYQVDPVAGTLLHVDLIRIAMDVNLRVRVPVHTFGEPQGVKLQGGIFEMVTREVEIECLPSEIPTEFRVDITDLMIGKHLRAGDLPLDPKMKLVTDPSRVIAHVVALRAEEEKPAEAAAVEGATPAEPEVIKKGKKEEEGEEGAEAGEKAKEKPKK